jgi:hypothetical protein
MVLFAVGGTAARTQHYRPGVPIEAPSPSFYWTRGNNGLDVHTVFMSAG